MLFVQALLKANVEAINQNDTRSLKNGDNVAGIHANPGRRFCDLWTLLYAITTDTYGETEFFDVKFCPYQPLDRDPVFAAVSKKHVRNAAQRIVKFCGRSNQLYVSGHNMQVVAACRGIQSVRGY